MADSDQGEGCPAADPFLVPGALVRCPEHPEWGLGQVQSVISGRATVNFEHAGKLVIMLSRVGLSVVAEG